MDISCLVNHWKPCGYWYRRFSDFFHEEGYSNQNTNKTITFLVPFSNTNYTITLGKNSNGWTHLAYTSLTKTTIIIQAVYQSTINSEQGSFLFTGY